ncbi:hypothetical protein ACQGFI_30055 [Rhodococcus sp. 2.95]
MAVTAFGSALRRIDLEWRTDECHEKNSSAEGVVEFISFLIVLAIVIGGIVAACS